MPPKILPKTLKDLKKVSLEFQKKKKNNNNNNNKMPSDNIPSSKVFLVGPESSGKSTLVSQLKHWTANLTAFSTISEPSLLIVNPTTGQEVDTITFKNGSSSGFQFPQPKLLQQLNEESERNLRMISSSSSTTLQSNTTTSQNQNQNHFPREFVELTLVSCLSKMSTMNQKKEEQDQSSSLLDTIKQEMMDNFEEAMKRSYQQQQQQQRKKMNDHDEQEEARMNTRSNNNETTSTTIHPAEHFESEIKIEIKEFGGRMAPMWDKFISSNNNNSTSSSSAATFDKLIFVVDVVTPLHIPLAAIEFWKCVKNVMSQSSSPTSSRKKFLVFVNKIRCPSIMKPEEVVESMFLFSKDDTFNDDSSSRKQMLDMMIAQKMLHVVVGDTWSGEGIPLVAAWLMWK